MASSVGDRSLKSERHRLYPSLQDKLLDHLSTMKSWLVDNQIRMPLAILSTLFAVHLFVDQPYTAKSFSLSHYNSSTQLYDKGAGDWAFVFTWVLVFTLLRAVLMRFIFSPIFHFVSPNQTPRAATRFAEQAWSAFYYSISFAIGLRIALNSPYWRDTGELWADYPQRQSDGLFKTYYLVESGFWIQQIFVLNIEARRKDFWQMLCHHFVTCTLIFMSYTYNVTRVGNAILCIMDLSDILLSLAKMLKYLELQRLCDVTFFLFLVSWPYTRHYIYIRILISAYFDAVEIFHRDNKDTPNYQVTPPKGGGNWGPGYDWRPEDGYYITPAVRLAFIILLSALQMLLLLWFAMIIRLAIRVLRGAHAEDDRSDDEDEPEESEESEDEEDTSISVTNGWISSNGVANGVHQRKPVAS